MQDNYDYFTQSKYDLKLYPFAYHNIIIKVIEIAYFFIILVGNGGLERLISSHVEVSKIGRQIAEEVLDLQKRGEDSSSGSSPGPAVTEPALLNTEVNIS